MNEIYIGSNFDDFLEGEGIHSLLRRQLFPDLIWDETYTSLQFAALLDHQASARSGFAEYNSHPELTIKRIGF